MIFYIIFGYNFEFIYLSVVILGLSSRKTMRALALYTMSIYLNKGTISLGK